MGTLWTYFIMQTRCREQFKKIKNKEVERDSATNAEQTTERKDEIWHDSTDSSRRD
jgi:hypothetical protein